MRIVFGSWFFKKAQKISCHGRNLNIDCVLGDAKEFLLILPGAVMASCVRGYVSVAG